MKKKEKEMKSEKNRDKEKINILNQLNYLSFSDKDKESKPSLKGEQKIKDNKDMKIKK